MLEGAVRCVRAKLMLKISHLPLRNSRVHLVRMAACVYMFTNSINGKRYVGQTWDLKRRTNEHLKGRGYSKLLCAAIAKYGTDNFTVRVLYRTKDQGTLDAVETLMIQLMGSLAPNGYNLALGGARGRHCAATKALIGSHHRGKVVSEATRNKLRASSLGHTVTLEQRSQLAQRNRARALQKHRPVYVFDSETRDMIASHRNLQLLNAYLKRDLSDQIRKGLRFEHDGRRCVVSYSDDPCVACKPHKGMRAVRVVVTETGVETTYPSLTAATSALGVGRGVLDSLVRGLYSRSKFRNADGKIEWFTAAYAT